MVNDIRSRVPIMLRLIRARAWWQFGSMIAVATISALHIAAIEKNGGAPNEVA